MRDKLYQISCPDLPPIEANGWNAENELYITVRCFDLPAPQAVSIIELIKCSCKAGSKGQCICSKNGLPCTPLCKCYVGDCTNTIIIRDDIRDSESDDDKSMIVILQCRYCNSNSRKETIFHINLQYADQSDWLTVVVNFGPCCSWWTRGHLGIPLFDSVDRKLIIYTSGWFEFIINQLSTLENT